MNKFREIIRAHASPRGGVCAIARKAGVGRAAVAAFMHGKDITATKLDAVLRTLGFSLAAEPLASTQSKPAPSDLGSLLQQAKAAAFAAGVELDIRIVPATTSVPSAQTVADVPSAGMAPSINNGSGVPAVA